MLIRKICMLGGSGFVGQTLANQLSQAGYEIKILSRNREAHRHRLILLPGVELVETNVHDETSLSRHFEGCDAVINLVGILNEKGRSGRGFQYAHVELVEKIISAAQTQGIQRILQMSALNADAENGPSHYLRSKGQAEALLFSDSSLKVSCFRPSVIFGENDSFFNRFASLLKISPLIFPLACAGAKFAPVFVEDIARLMVLTLNDPTSFGRYFCACGPETYTLGELVEYTSHCLGSQHKVIPLNDTLSRIQAALFDFVPGKPFSTDNYLSTKVDSICTQNDFDEYGIRPTAIEGIVPRYLSKQIQRENYYQYRQKARR